MQESLLKVVDLSKNFSGVPALTKVQLDILPGEVHALLGENGAGKSTLLKALAGAQPQSSGDIYYKGNKLNLHDSPNDRQLQGIVTIYQEFSLLPNLTVAENMYLGRETIKNKIIVDNATINQLAQEVLNYLKLNIQPTDYVYRLSVAQQQMVEIARALTLNASLIIMDEPSAALSDSEVEVLHNVVRSLKKNNISVVYVTHRLKEVFSICDRYTVLQDGKYSGTGIVKDSSIKDIIRLMVGRDVQFTRRDSSQTHHKDKPVALSVRNLSRDKKPLDPMGISLHDISFDVHEGEVLGIAGLVGAGRTEIAKCLYGMDTFTGEIYLNGEKYDAKSPLDSLHKGIALVPEDRKKEGLALNLSILENFSISNLEDYLKYNFIVDTDKENQELEKYRKNISIKMASPNLEVGKLSGGNQQKVILARCIALSPKLLIVDEPTRGIDVGAKSEVHNVLFDLAKTGVSVIVISSDLPEIIAISDRIITLCEGRVTGEIHGDDASEEILMSMMVNSGNLNKKDN